ncbi:MAG TPA: dihydroorotate dehydrogenase electron transfer subunit [Candidatus Methylomirabilis sp.]|nr:dihydroorotate dehydrogenase electron transfer subunit [Candidatus Methylomirabilis sp.]
MRASVAFHRRISTGYRHLGLHAPGFPAAFQAGQFVMVRPPWLADPFLPRAFSIYRISSSSVDPPADRPGPVVEILYKVLGKGTQYLSRMEAGQAVEVLGPFGNSFTLPPADGLAVLVAGGIGVPPIAALAAQIRNSKFEIRNLDVFLGGKTSEDILCVKDFEEAGATLHIATEDGSLGAKGLITDLLEPYLITHHVLRSTLYTCGPPGMLAAVGRLAAERRIPCQVSVEANMACGFGACMGCAIEVQGPDRRYKLVCKDGPVFDSREIVWK